MTVRTWRWASTFDSLRKRDFRWLWLGRVISSATFSMGTVAQGWLVYELTGSGAALAWVNSGWSISTLCLSLFGGVLSDRVEKRSILLWARAASVLQVLALGLLIGGGFVRIWLLMASSLLSGVFFSIMMPAQQAITAELVDRETLLNAISLNSIGMGVMGALTSSAAGFLIQYFGVASVYYAIAALNLVTAFTVLKLPSSGRTVSPSRSVWRDLFGGLHYIRQRPTLVIILLLVLVRVFFGMPYRTLMPKFATDVMGFDAAGLGLLMAGPGVGSLISSLTVASLGDFRRKGRLLLVTGVILGVSLALFVNAPALPLVFLFLVLVGASGNACMVLNNTLLQTNVEDRFRGRVMSVYMLMWGLSPVGTIPAGAVSDLMGVRFVVTLQGVLCTATFLSFLLFRRDIKRME
ncbi:MAG: MFS transporter [Anaerolineales bacterium]|nr:MAG: MFS transporter [Anaerolineales bacterium]